MAAKKPNVKNWLQASKATHGDGNLSAQAPVKGPRANGPITRVDGVKAQAAPKGKTADKPTAVFGNKSGGGAGPAGGGKVMFAKGLMQKGK